MRRMILGAILSLALAAPAQTLAGPAKWFEADYKVDYLKTYAAAAEAGHDVGRNVVDDWLASGEEPQRWQVENKDARMELMLNPPPAPEPVVSDEPETVSSEPAYSPPAYSSGGCPASMAGEATSPDAVNPTSGASGCYQVLPSTADAMGSACDDVNATSCLDAICAAQGNDAWVAADPCYAKD